MRNSFSGLGGERRREREFEFLLMLFEEIDVLTASFIVKKMQFRGNTRFKREGERMKHCGNKTFHFVHLMNPGSIFAPLALFWPPQHFLIEMKKKVVRSGIHAPAPQASVVPDLSHKQSTAMTTCQPWTNRMKEEWTVQVPWFWGLVLGRFTGFIWDFWLKTAATAGNKELGENGDSRTKHEHKLLLLLCWWLRSKLANVTLLLLIRACPILTYFLPYDSIRHTKCNWSPATKSLHLVPPF